MSASSASPRYVGKSQPLMAYSAPRHSALTAERQEAPAWRAECGQPFTFTEQQVQRDEDRQRGEGQRQHMRVQIGRG